MRLLIKKIFASCRIPTLFLVVLFSALAPSISLAQTAAGAFTPLVGIPGIDPDADFNSYINALYVLSISLGALLAVVKIIIAGVKWMLTDLISGKEDAKKDIQGALTGLLIIISAVLILTVINPKLVDFELNFGSISDTSSGGVGNPGTGTISATDCVVPLNQSNCVSNVTWSTTGVTTPSIRHNGLTISTAPSGNIPRNISPRSRGTLVYSFAIFSGNAQIASTPAQASCALGSTWNGSICVSGGGGNPGIGTISATDCVVSLGQSNCDSIVTWTTTDVTAPSIRHNSITFSNAPSGNGFVRPISAGSGGALPHSFAIFSGNAQIASIHAQASCAPGSIWNGSICVSGGTGTISATDCVVSLGQSNCVSNVTWSTIGVTAPSIRHNSITFSIAPSGNIPRNISPRSGGTLFNSVHSFVIFNGNAHTLAVAIAQASCALGSTWNGSICVSGGGGGTGTGTISATDCVVPLGQSNCDSIVTWTTTDVTAPSIRHNSITFSTVPSGNGFVRPISAGSFGTLSHSFAIFSGNAQIALASTHAQASCATGSIWNGSICVSGGGGN